MTMHTPGSNDIRWGDRVIRRDGPHWCKWDGCCTDETIVDDAMLDYMASCQYWVSPGPHEPVSDDEFQFMLSWQDHLFSARRIPHPDEYNQ